MCLEEKLNWTQSFLVREIFFSKPVLLPSSMAFLTARKPSLTASLICVRVCLLGPFTSRVTERGFPHFSMNVYFSSPCKHDQRKLHLKQMNVKSPGTDRGTRISTHQCVFVNQTSISQAVRCEVINWIHGNATASEGEPGKGTRHSSDIW